MNELTETVASVAIIVGLVVGAYVFIMAPHQRAVEEIAYCMADKGDIHSEAYYAECVEERKTRLAAR